MDGAEYANDTQIMATKIVAALLLSFLMFNIISPF
jgi:hypothetical protein